MILSQHNIFSDRSVQHPGRFRLTDISTNTTQDVDVARSEGVIYQAGTPFSAEVMNRMCDDISDAGQDYSDAISANWAALTVNSIWFSGAVKYNKIGNIVIVYVNLLQTGGSSGTSALSGSADAATNNLPSALRPLSSQNGTIRRIQNLSGNEAVQPYLYVNSAGKVVVYCNGTSIPSNRYIRGEIVYML